MKQLLLDNRKDVIAAAVLLAIALCLHLFIGLPRHRQNLASSQRMKGLDAQIQQASVSVNEMTALLDSDSTVSEMYDQSTDEILPDLFDAIADQGRLHGVEIVSMTPGGIQRMSIQGTGPLQVNAEATHIHVEVVATARYRSLGEYLRSLEQIPILVAVRDLRVERAPNSSLVRANFTIETYSVRTIDAQAK